LIVMAGALLVLILESISVEAGKKYAYLISLLAMIGGIAAAVYAPASENSLLTPWLRFDDLSRFFTILFLAIGFGTTLLAAAFFQRFEATNGEYYFLLMSTIFGLILIGDSADFLTLFLGIETLSISLYVLCTYMKKWEISQEAALKYFIMGSLATAILLYGIALIYGATGTTRFDALLNAYQSVSSTGKVLFLSGIALVTIGLAFEAAVVPFHVWAPDVYSGAPMPVTAFMSVGTKIGAFAAFARVFLVALPQFDVRWNEGVQALAFLTLIYANYVALRQNYLRRFFAYSGISHAGFALIPLVAGTPDALPALQYYLVIYALATLGCFAVLAFLDKGRDGVKMSDLNGLFRRSPWLAGILALCLLTLAGIPPTAGFFAKFFLFKVAFQAGYYALVIVGLLTAVLAAYYYLRFVTVMLSETPEEATPPVLSWSAATIGVISSIAIIVLSFYPTPLLTILGFVAH
jgi:NADH-quinone oxidoreductase subunit N